MKLLKCFIGLVVFLSLFGGLICGMELGAKDPERSDKYKTSNKADAVQRGQNKVDKGFRKPGDRMIKKDKSFYMIMKGKLAELLKDILSFDQIKFCEREEDLHRIKYRKKDKKIGYLEDICKNGAVLKTWICETKEGENIYEKWAATEDSGQYKFFPGSLYEEYCMNQGGICLDNESGDFGYCTDCVLGEELLEGEEGGEGGKENTFCIVNESNPHKPAQLITACGIFTNYCKGGVDNIVMAYTCDESYEDNHCEMTPIEVPCPGGQKCYGGVCASEEQSCIDSDVDNVPQDQGYVYDSEHVLVVDYCNNEGQLIQANCKCPDAAQKTDCVGGVYEYGAPENGIDGGPHPACQPATGEGGQMACPKKGCYTDTIVFEEACPCDICVQGMITLTPCVEGKYCVSGECVHEFGDLLCEKTDVNGNEPGGGTTSLAWSGLADSQDLFPDGCGFQDNTKVREYKCEFLWDNSNPSMPLIQYDKVDCPGEKICYKGPHPAPAICIDPPSTEGQACERVDPNPNQAGGGYAETTNVDGVSHKNRDRCKNGNLIVEERVCDGNVLGTNLEKPCPNGTFCYEPSGQVPAYCVPLDNSTCTRTDSDGPDVKGGGFLTCTAVGGIEMVANDFCQAYATPWMKEMECKNGNVLDCLDKWGSSNNVKCSDGDMCYSAEGPKTPATCVPIQYDSCNRVEPILPNNPGIQPKAGYVTLIKSNLETSVKDKCMSNNQVITVHCPPDGVPLFESNLIYNGTDNTDNCHHKCVSITGNYPGDGYCNE